MSKKYSILFLFFVLMTLASCHRVVMQVDQVPSNTPPGEPVYITGNFNNWDPGDTRFRLTLYQDSTYSVKLPSGFGMIRYKFTRGDWTTVEKDICGNELTNRSFVLGTSDTVINVIESWNDLDPVNCPQVTVLLTRIPDQTSKNNIIAIAGNFNSWIPDSASVMIRDSRGHYYLTFTRQAEIDEIDYKITRGDLSSVETDIFGNDVPVRKLQFGKSDTIIVNVENWKDISPHTIPFVTIICKSIPHNTPANDDIYLLSNLNNWSPWDRNYVLQKNTKGEYFIRIPKRKGKMEFKFTRGDWSTVEVDEFGFEIFNRQLDFQNQDTFMVNIENWKDMTRESSDEIKIKLISLPANTPQNAHVYLAGNFNHWRTDDSRYELQKNKEGIYEISVPRKRGTLEFKVTRGDWSNSEIDSHGSDMPNRIYFYNKISTLEIIVENWKDIRNSSIEGVTILLRTLPKDTPVSDDIFLAADFNGWDPGNPAYMFTRDDKGNYSLSVNRPGSSMEFKITRGDWKNVEVDEYGEPIPNRVFYFNFSDTLYIDIPKWRDFGGEY